MAADKKSGHKSCGDPNCGHHHEHHHDEGEGKSKQADLQNKFMAYQVAEQQIKQHQEQLNKFQMQIQEVSSVIQSLDDISKVKKGDEVLVPLAGGIFFRARMDEGQRFLVNVGGGTVVEKSLEDTKAIILSQLEEIEHYKDHVTENLANLIAEYQLLEAELKDLIG